MENNTQKQQQNSDDSDSNKKESTNSGGNNDTPSTSSSKPRSKLIPDGSKIFVQFDEINVYCDLYEQFKLNEYTQQLTAIRHGLSMILDRAKLDWTKDVAVPTSTANQMHTEIRFDLDGDVIAPNDDPQQLLGLHHHGRNPTSAEILIKFLHRALHLEEVQHHLLMEKVRQEEENHQRKV